MTDTKHPTRGILYYPTINIPTGQWLRQALLYWDEIGSIVPHEFDEIGSFSPDIQFLSHEGIFKPFDPHIAVYEYENISPLAGELYEIISSRYFKIKLGTIRQPKLNKTIYSQKIAGPVFEKLESLGLARRAGKGSYLFEENTFHIYMALLAKYICIGSDYNGTLTPGTDVVAYQRLIFQTQNPGRGIPSFSLQLGKVLPTPAEDTPLDHILDFKNRRKDELLRFRLMLSELQTRLQSCQSEQQISETLMNFQERIVIDLSDLSDALKSDKINLVLSTLTTILTFQLGDVIKQMFGPISIPLPTFIGSLTVGNCLTKAHQLNETARKSPVSYLLHAIEEFS